MYVRVWLSVDSTRQQDSKLYNLKLGMDIPNNTLQKPTTKRSMPKASEYPIKRPQENPRPSGTLEGTPGLLNPKPFGFRI